MNNKEKLESLKKQVKEYRKEEDPKIKENLSSGSMAFNIAVELVAGMIVGFFLGTFLDKIFDSKPSFLIICLIMALIAAFKSIWNKYVEK